MSEPYIIKGKQSAARLQLIGHAFDKETVFKVAEVIEREAGQFAPEGI